MTATSKVDGLCIAATGTNQTWILRMPSSRKHSGLLTRDGRLFLTLLIVSACFSIVCYAVLKLAHLQNWQSLAFAASFGALIGLGFFFPAKRVAQVKATNTRLRKANRTLELLYAASTAIIDSDHLEEMLGKVVSILVKHFGAMGGAVSLVEGPSPTRVFVRATDLTDEQRASVAKLEADWSQAHLLVIGDTTIQPSFTPESLPLSTTPSLENDGIAAGHTWYVPLETHPNAPPIGVLVLFFDPPEDPEDTARSALLPIARHLGAAILNARLLEKAQWQAVTDPLTGLYNRRALDRWLNTELQLAQKADRPIALLMIDLDGFKEINDTYGHLIGDQVLAHTSVILQEIIRSDDMVVRFGGEEFAILLRNASVERAAETAERIRSRFAQYDWTVFGIRSHSLTVSLGVISCRGEMDNPDTLIAAADRLLYQAKQNGKNCVAIGSDVASIVGLGHNTQSVLAAQPIQPLAPPECMVG